MFWGQWVTLEKLLVLKDAPYMGYLLQWWMFGSYLRDSVFVGICSQLPNGQLE